MTDPDTIAPLLQAAAGGDRRAFGALYAATSAKLFGVLLRILRDRSEAEDALQDVFTKVWNGAGRYDATRGRGMTWLITIARNRAIDRLRARPRTDHSDIAPDDLSDGKPGVESRLIAMGDARQLADCMNTLEPDRAAALRGAYLSGESYDDLAQRHNVPLNTMRTWLRRGLMKLRECLGS